MKGTREMKKVITYPVILLIFILISGCNKMDKNKHYPVNQSPLLQTKFVKLPLGTIKPEGWLKDQLVSQSKGLTGYLDEFWPDLIHSAWRGGDGESWERGPYYLDGLIPLAYLLNDQRLIEKINPWIEWIINSSRSDGWFGPETNKDRWPLAVTMKVLTQYYEATNDSRAIEVLKNYFNYLLDNPPDWPDDTWRGVRAMENAVTGYWLFRRTGDPGILKVVQSIYENSFDWTNFFTDFPWNTEAIRNDKIPHNWKSDGLTAHVVNIGMAVKYPGLWFQQSREEFYKNAVYSGIANLDEHHGQVGGRFSGDEHVSGKRPAQGTEMCAVVEYMFSLENLIEIMGDPVLSDRLEFLTYNCLPGTMTPDCWAHQYDQQSNQVLISNAQREWSTNGNTSNVYGLMPNYPCCLANMHQGWPKFVQHMWMATHDQGLAAITYGPCRVSAKVGNNIDVSILEETGYPFDGKIKLTVELPKAAEFPIYLRIPGWAQTSQIKYSGETVDGEPGTMVKIQRTWQPGDTIELEFPMNIRTERRFNNSVSIIRGPLYFSLRIGKKYKKIKLKSQNISSIDYRGSVDWEIKPTTAWNYGLIIDKENIEKDISVRRHPVRKFPFSDKGELIYSDEERKYKPWNEEAPVVLEVKGKRIPQWKIENNSAADPPLSPVKSNEKIETLELVPYGCARLRITEFPVIEADK